MCGAGSVPYQSVARRVATVICMLDCRSEGQKRYLKENSSHPFFLLCLSEQDVEGLREVEREDLRGASESDNKSRAVLSASPATPSPSIPC
eukprot:106102-Hanusia_phi.AAC.1